VDLQPSDRLANGGGVKVLFEIVDFGELGHDWSGNLVVQLKRGEVGSAVRSIPCFFYPFLAPAAAQNYVPRVGLL
jgi:hypothetical protein